MRTCIVKSFLGVVWWRSLVAFDERVVNLDKIANHVKGPSVAVVGTGYWGKNLVRNFSALGALHTVCDRDPDTLQTFQEKYPGVATAQSYPEVLNNPDINGVVIATPAGMHADMVREAILFGKDVYVEKPLCLSEEEAAGLVELAREKDRILMVGHLLWYHPVVLKLKELVDSGALGRIQYIYSNRLNLGKLRREENVLWSFAPHDISVILGLTGEEPEVVQAEGGNYLHRRIADTTVTLLRFASGVRAHIFVSWLHPFKEQKLVVVGERQMAVFNDTLPWKEKLELFPHSIEWSGNVPVATKAEGQFVEVPQDEPLRAECLHFLESMQSRQTPRTDGREGLRVLKVLNACQSALETRKAVVVGKQPSTLQAYSSHESAVIDSGVEIGKGTKIWHFSHILSGSKIGESCSIGQNVVIGPNVKVGKGCKIQNNVSIYDGVILEDDVFCGPSMVFTNIVNPRSHISRKSEFRVTLVKCGCTIGANATIVCGTSLGQYSFIGAGAVVTRDVSDYALMVGNPARQVGWMSRYGERLDLPLSGNQETTCPHTGDRYSLDGEHLQNLTESKN